MNLYKINNFNLIIKSNTVSLISDSYNKFEIDLSDTQIEDIYNNINDLYIEENNKKIILYTKNNKIYIPQVLYNIDYKDIEIKKLNNIINELENKINKLENKFNNIELNKVSNHIIFESSLIPINIIC
jgi:hypothetical protein